MFDFSNQVVMITGAAGNLGEATARAFQAAGAKLALVDNRADRLDKLFADWAENVYFLPSVDITNADAVLAMAEKAREHYGRIDILVNVAGGFRMGPPLHETDPATWDLMMNLNAKSVLLTANAVVPGMVAQGSGRVVNVAARASSGKANMGPYIAAKSAVIRLTETMSAELRHQGINVNCILPGTIDTPQNRNAMPNADFDKWVPPAALADVILFLCSPAARAVTGAAMPVVGRS